MDVFTHFAFAAIAADYLVVGLGQASVMHELLLPSQAIHTGNKTSENGYATRYRFCNAFRSIGVQLL